MGRELISLSPQELNSLTGDTKDMVEQFDNTGWIVVNLTGGLSWSRQEKQHLRGSFPGEVPG